MKRLPNRNRVRTIYACAFVVSASFIGIAQTHASTDARDTTGDVRIQGDKARPYLIFGCDRQTGDLDSLFTPALVSELKELGAGVALSTEDFSFARAHVVRRLSDAGIPMTAWIVLPLTMLGCIYYPWKALAAVPWLQKLVLINPLVYMCEGFRAA